MDDSAVIRAERLTRRYGGRTGFDAVRGVDLSVRRGELFALLGTNGAGKTSTLEVLEGLAAPTSGSVRLLGRDPFRERRFVRSRVGILLQDAGFPMDLTVGETATTWARTVSRPRPVGDALDQAGLTGRERVRVRQLSGGERKKLGLALAIMGQPEVLFLDEPTAGLDPQSRRHVWHLIDRLLATGTTILLTTHYLAEAAELADRLAILHRGRIVALGTPTEIAATRPARITFSLPTGTPFPELAGATVTVDGSQAVLTTEDLQQTLESVLRWAGSEGLKLHDLTARPASLEEAFLAIAESGDGQEVAA
ncbi:ABC-2 type transport system ATP-binding protein [Kribbella voronezhensis]|uniref:ABC-2 type transport system ATP-binding protein n=1 Tax=Kribbella voronezhensis TaxID=2512212 RepID=A0A4R7TGH0_9ACTN|nr:ABC transporter ATP-binding protein [Kribbella voronezhensis]TDU90706.1 ABC-2 type transport system ATP-binding protein [Kribbella voronezhensis]